ncbi:MAG: pyruvate, phosphate dikinase [Bacteroidales bacterium]|jgi:pyruvate,orthophosphate dikinase|nr:pyruvate, phosphate dikinase [Bacteroidales bacterium]HHV39774.1 pyruvate, phosphate dikinase [Bacteroidales bacterium]
MSEIKRVYSFGGKTAEGDGTMRNLLGGKGANLAEMCLLGMPVPAGFTITTDTCTEYYALGCNYPQGLAEEVEKALKKTEEVMEARYGDPQNPLLLSCRSGARSSMPGMMETVLNIGLCAETIEGLIKKTNNPRFVYDAYRRLIMMYSDVVMEKAEGIEPEEGKGIRVQLDGLMQKMKADKGYKSDTDLTAEDLKDLCDIFKEKVQEVLGKPFPDNAMEQLWGSIGAVLKSWNGKRAIAYRRIEGIPDEWGTAVTVQSMVYGNMGENSATGVAFSRNPATGEAKFYGEWLLDAQGEDVVAGIRTPSPLNEATKTEQTKDIPSLESVMPKAYQELDQIQKNLEAHFRDMQDIEFTIQEGRLWMLQCRVGKRTGVAALNMAMDMVAEGLIDKKTAVMRVAPAQLDELLHPILDSNSEKKAKVVARGLPAGPGGAVGQIVFTAEDAVAWHSQGKRVILVREETNPEDVEGMRVADGLLTARGGMTSHAALVARGWGKCAIVGCEAVHLDVDKRIMTINGKEYPEGTVFSLNGTRGFVYDSKIETMDASENPRFKEFMDMVDTFRTMGVRANADTPEAAQTALDFGAEGIGLFRIEHMFYGLNAEAPLSKLRKIILSENAEERQQAINELAPYVKVAAKETLRVMDGLPLTFRLLDPPLHEFVPQTLEIQKELAEELNISVEEIIRRSDLLKEVNPMMGHRGVRLGISYPEISEMQIRAIFSATAELIKEGLKPIPEIMVPVTLSVKELDDQKAICDRVHKEVEEEFGISFTYVYGTMIEIPRATLLADEMARNAEFFSFGTNDLTQMTYGFSRDDIGSFLGEYIDKKILPFDPFQHIDEESVGVLMETAVEKGRSTNPGIELGICGEHGGDPQSVHFCYKLGLTYVSCSPFRIPIARLAAAQAAIMDTKS